MIPAGPQAFGLESDVKRFLAFQQVEGDAPQPREVLGGMSRANPAFVLSESHVQRPVNLVFDARRRGDPRTMAATRAAPVPSRLLM